MRKRHSCPVLRVVALAFILPFAVGAAEFPSFQEFEIREQATREDVFEEPPRDFDVPGVSRRDYDPETMERLNVQSIVIRNVIPNEERGITPEAVQAVVDEAFEAQRDIQLDAYGWTAYDYQEIGAYVRDIADRNQALLDMDDMDRLVRLLRELEAKQGWITIEQLESIATAVTTYYRDRGLILATAYIPAQEVTDGVVYMEVLEGTLGDVTVSNNRIYADNTIARAFNPEIGGTVTEESIEGTLRRINDLPGVRVRGSFSPGNNTGETSLNLDVLDEASWAANVVVDNHGSPTTGEGRVFATNQWLNMAGKGHRLMVGALRAEGPESSTYGLVEYEMPLTSSGRGDIAVSVSSNEFSIANFPDLGEIVGETVNYAVKSSYQVIRSRILNLGWDVEYTQKDVVFDVPDVPQLSTDQVLESWTGAVTYTQLWDEQQLLVNGRLGFALGHMIRGEADEQSTNFNKILFSANILKRLEIFNWLTKGESPINFVTKITGQYSEYFLAPVEQFSLGGPAAVRSFNVSDVSVDSGVYAGFELFFNLPPVEEIFQFDLDPPKPFLFFDYAYGVSRATASAVADYDAEIKGWGLGMRLSWRDRGVINLIFARPYSQSFESPNVTARGKERFYVDFTYRLH